MPDNCLKILLGLALVYGNQGLYDQVIGSLRTPPSELEYDRARNSDSIFEVLKMLELTLYSAVVSIDIEMANKIIQFSKKHSYMLGLSNQVCMHVLKTRL